MNAMSWPSRLTELLKERRWSLTDLERAMNGYVSQPTISRWISQKKFPRLDEAIELAKVLNVSLDDLAELNGPVPANLTQTEQELLIVARRLGHDRAMGRLLGIPRADDFGPLPSSR